MRISKQTIDEVTNNADIVQIISEHVSLTPKGDNWWGNCPFHGDKTPSFSVSPSKGFYYCFSCKAHGNAVGFLMEAEGLSYPDAIVEIANKSGITVRYENNGQENQEDQQTKLKNEYIELYDKITVTFHYLLTQDKSGKFALDYIKSRGITDQTIEKFKLGYSPSNLKWLRGFLEKKSYSKEFLDNSGLFCKGNQQIAFFNERLMFPIFDKNGQTIAFGGRILHKEQENFGKYLNTNDCIQFKKGTVLYAWNLAKSQVAKQKSIIIVEGYMDCIAFHQCGITNVVASLGTALTEDHIKLFKRMVDTVYLSFDSDEAGQKATLRSIKMCRQNNLDVKIVQFRTTKDAGEVVQNYGEKAAEILTNDINTAILDNDFLLSRLSAQYSKDSPEGKYKASQELFEYIECLQTNIQKDAWLKQFCQVFEIDLEAAKQDYYTSRDNNLQKNSSKFVNRQNQTVQKNQNQAVQENYRPSLELKAVITAITDRQEDFLLMRNEVSVDDLSDPMAKKMFIILEECSRSQNFSIKNIINRCEEDAVLKELIYKHIMEQTVNTSGMDSTQIEQALQSQEIINKKSLEDSIKLLKKNVYLRRQQEIQNSIKRLERSSLEEDKARLNALMVELMDITKLVK